MPDATKLYSEVVASVEDTARAELARIRSEVKPRVNVVAGARFRPDEDAETVGSARRARTPRSAGYCGLGPPRARSGAGAPVAGHGGGVGRRSRPGHLCRSRAGTVTAGLASPRSARTRGPGHWRGSGSRSDTWCTAGRIGSGGDRRRGRGWGVWDARGGIRGRGPKRPNARPGCGARPYSPPLKSNAEEQR